jgi:hypothetical protein
LATIDTGTSVVIAPQADAQAIYAAIPGSNLGQNGLFTYPCSANPDVALNFAGQNFNIKAADSKLYYFRNAANVLPSYNAGLCTI